MSCQFNQIYCILYLSLAPLFVKTKYETNNFLQLNPRSAIVGVWTNQEEEAMTELYNLNFSLAVWLTKNSFKEQRIGIGIKIEMRS